MVGAVEYRVLAVEGFWYRQLAGRGSSVVRFGLLGIGISTITAAVLGTVLNLRFYLDFMADLRDGVELGTLATLAENFVRRYTAGDSAS